MRSGFFGTVDTDIFPSYKMLVTLAATRDWVASTGSSTISRVTINVFLILTVIPTTKIFKNIMSLRITKFVRFYLFRQECFPVRAILPDGEMVDKPRNIVS